MAEAQVIFALAFVHMEEEVQDRVQAEVGRDEQGGGETRGKELGEEQRVNKPQMHDMDYHVDDMTRTNTFLSHDVSVHH